MARNFPDGQGQIVLIEGQPGGWLLTAELAGKSVWGIMVMPECRGQGIGSATIKDVLAAYRWR